MSNATRQNKNTKRDRKSALVESLEDRRLMSSSVELVNGMLILQGKCQGHNRLAVTPDQGGQTVFARANGVKEHYLLKEIKSIRIIGGEKADNVVVDDSIKKSCYVRAGAGDDSVTT